MKTYKITWTDEQSKVSISMYTDDVKAFTEFMELNCITYYCVEEV